MKNILACASSSSRVWTENKLNDDDEHLVIYCKELSTIFKAWRHLTESMKKVTINVFTEDPTFAFDPTCLDHKIHTSIKEINFNCYTHRVWLNLILDVCPLVEKLHFFKLTKEKLEYAANNLEYLRHVSCDYMEIDTMEFYHNLKATKTDINKSILIKCFY